MQTQRDYRGVPTGPGPGITPHSKSELMPSLPDRDGLHERFLEEYDGGHDFETPKEDNNES